MFNYRYDLISADLDYKIHKHPQQDLLDRNLQWIKCEPCSVADCWFFRFNTAIENPPPYLTRISDNWRFADERKINE